MSWNQALKKWNSNKDTWCIPKKGTKDHAEVKKIQGKILKISDAMKKSVKIVARKPTKKVVLKKRKTPKLPKKPKRPKKPKGKKEAIEKFKFLKATTNRDILKKEFIGIIKDFLSEINEFFDLSINDLRKIPKKDRKRIEDGIKRLDNIAQEFDIKIEDFIHAKRDVKKFKVLRKFSKLRKDRRSGLIDNTPIFDDLKNLTRKDIENLRDSIPKKTTMYKAKEIIKQLIKIIDPLVSAPDFFFNKDIKIIHKPQIGLLLEDMDKLTEKHNLKLNDFYTINGIFGKEPDETSIERLNILRDFKKIRRRS